MDVFDNVNEQTLDRRDRQLSFLALLIIVILGLGMALLMYPAVFSKTVGANTPSLRILFFGFCALCVLLVAYLLDRHFVVQRLRKRLYEQRERMQRLLVQSSSELLGTLLGFSHFQDRLTMDFRRSTQTQDPLSLILVRLVLASPFSEGAEAQVALGDAAKVLSRKLRTEDSLYRLSSHVFGVVLPGMTEATATAAADRLSEGLSGASGASNRFTAEVEVVSYPQHVTTASEMERHASTMIAQD